MNDSQAQHDRRHPGAVCRQCPSVVAYNARLDRLLILMDRSPWWVPWWWIWWRSSIVS